MGFLGSGGGHRGEPWVLKGQSEVVDWVRAAEERGDGGKG